jgi:hypothetical protein
MTTPYDATEATGSDADWIPLYRVGGAAALIAAVLFRRNIAAEISLFAAQAQPDSIQGWYSLLQTNRLLGLAYLNLFDVVNYTLLGLMFLALYVLLRRASPSYMAIAALLAFAGITIYLVANPALSMLSLSEQFAAATDVAQQASMLAAGQAILVMDRFTAPEGLPGSGGYYSLLLLATAGIITSAVMLRSHLFGRVTAYVGMAAAALDLAYCALIFLAPGSVRDLVGLAFIPLAGLLLMIWHILVGLRLLKLSRA